jgi:hypothetical protein
MSQAEHIYNILSDGLPHRTDELVREVYHGGALARLGARIYDVQKKHNVKIESWHDPYNRKLWWYRIVGRKTNVEATVARINAIPAKKAVEQAQLF